MLFPKDTPASDLNPDDPGNADFPQFGHGSIALDGLFNDKEDKEWQAAPTCGGGLR